ncbi:MAG: DUF839 domain-containing protein [Verrucomicrobiae bacterium]|nr:DUF839 domain-containing protein [Verrucomicrobiae bacterium]
MKKNIAWPSTLVLGASLIAAPALHAGTDTWFTPLTTSATVVNPNDIEELTAPWVAPAGLQQINWVSLAEVENPILSPGQTIQRVAGLDAVASMFDMTACHPNGTHLFIPHETEFGAGVTRYDIYANSCQLLFAGDGSGNWTSDYGAFDPCRWTPNGTLFLAEEWSGTGKVVEVLNPMDDPNSIQTRQLTAIPRVAHEGINFSLKYKNTIYFIDEYNSGSIYKFVMAKRGDYTKGQTFVLRVDDFVSTGGVAEDNWDEQAQGVSREGRASWIPLTDKNGVALAGITDPFRDGPSTDPRSDNTCRGGRPAADDVDATPYGRPEDMMVSRLRNGREVVYVCITSEQKVLSIEMINTRGGAAGPQGGGRAIVRTFLSDAGTPKNLGFPGTTGILNSPDNLAMDGAGNIYVIEDQPNGSSTGGDIWFARDRNSDGVAESLDHFLSLRADGSESTGMIFNPAVPTEFHISVQHPDSTNLNNVPDGFGDAVWTFNLSGIDNKRFVRSLTRGRFRRLTNQ